MHNRGSNKFPCKRFFNQLHRNVELTSQDTFVPAGISLIPHHSLGVQSCEPRNVHDVRKNVPDT